MVVLIRNTFSLTITLYGPEMKTTGACIRPLAISLSILTIKTSNLPHTLVNWISPGRFIPLTIRKMAYSLNASIFAVFRIK
ncbi:hypothetical protein D3C85_1380030 [compost metagenome]